MKKQIKIILMILSAFIVLNVSCSAYFAYLGIALYESVVPRYAFLSIITRTVKRYA